MYKINYVKLTNINENIICTLCGGYFINATTISECLHSFCSSCILKYVEENKCCPVCKTLIHKTKPQENLKPDRTLQALVYKLVPGLFKKEMKNRRDFYAAHPTIDLKASINESEERGEISDEPLRHDDFISVHLVPTHRMKCGKKNLHRIALGSSSSSLSSGSDGTAGSGSDSGVSRGNGSSVSSEDDRDRVVPEARYLLCPSSLSVALLEKFIRSKFNLHTEAKVGIWHAREKLAKEYTLGDIALLYKWTRVKPLKLVYVIYESASLQHPVSYVTEKFSTVSTEQICCTSLKQHQNDINLDNAMVSIGDKVVDASVESDKQRLTFDELVKMPTASISENPVQPLAAAVSVTQNSSSTSYSCIDNPVVMTIASQSSACNLVSEMSQSATVLTTTSITNAIPSVTYPSIIAIGQFVRPAASTQTRSVARKFVPIAPHSTSSTIRPSTPHENLQMDNTKKPTYTLLSQQFTTASSDTRLHPISTTVSVSTNMGLQVPFQSSTVENQLENIHTTSVLVNNSSLSISAINHESYNSITCSDKVAVVNQNFVHAGSSSVVSQSAPVQVSTSGTMYSNANDMRTVWCNGPVGVIPSVMSSYQAYNGNYAMHCSPYTPTAGSMHPGFRYYGGSPTQFTNPSNTMISPMPYAYFPLEHLLPSNTDCVTPPPNKQARRNVSSCRFPALVGKLQMSGLTNDKVTRSPVKGNCSPNDKFLNMHANMAAIQQANSSLV